MTIERKVERLIKVGVRLMRLSDMEILKAQTICPHHKTSQASGTYSRSKIVRCDLCGKFLHD